MLLVKKINMVKTCHIVQVELRFMINLSIYIAEKYSLNIEISVTDLMFNWVNILLRKI